MEYGVTFEGNLVSHPAGDITLKNTTRIMAGAKPKSSCTWKPTSELTDVTFEINGA
jgi:hypothetical protein